MDLSLLLATALGIGFVGIAPGTFGSLPGLFFAITLGGMWHPAALMVGTVLVTIVGFLTAGRAERRLGQDDPGPVVIDEVAGQMLTLWLVPLNVGTLAMGFFLFRLMDVLKPFPARRLEKLHGATGIMTDDLVAGLYANLLLQILLRTLPAGWLTMP